MPQALAKETDLTSRSWTMDSLRDYVLGLRTADDARYAERHAGILELFKAHDLRYEQLAAAQEKAIDTAMVAAEKAVNAALGSSREAIQKAELSADKRFESVNEFRSTLGDQQRMLMPRAEVEVLVKSISEKISASSEAIRHVSDLFNQLAARREGQHTGITNGWGGAVAIFGFVSLILSIIFKFIK